MGCGAFGETGAYAPKVSTVTKDRTRAQDHVTTQLRRRVGTSALERAQRVSSVRRQTVLVRGLQFLSRQTSEYPTGRYMRLSSHWKLCKKASHLQHILMSSLLYFLFPRAIPYLLTLYKIFTSHHTFCIYLLFIIIHCSTAFFHTIHAHTSTR